jgi:hypothetical protein
MGYEKRLVNGKEHLFATIEFDLGEIQNEERKNLEDGTTVISMPMYIHSLKEMLKETLINNIVNEKFGKFEQNLKEYCNLYMNDVIGVESHPMRYDKDGKIVGLKEGIEIDEN